MPGEEDSVERIRKQREAERRKAVETLAEFRQRKITLARPVFFVPGWTDEDCTCWKRPYPRTAGRPIRQWIDEVTTNPGHAHYVTFTDKESKACKSFFDFAALLKQRIWSAIGKHTSFDAVGHSMGGLDIVAVLIGRDEPLTNVHYFITVATPHRGSQLGGIARAIGRQLQNLSAHHAVQAGNLDPDHRPIKRVNKLKPRGKVLASVYEFYSLIGTRDMAVMNSARYNLEDLDRQLVAEKYQLAEVGGAGHSGPDGITQDPRAVLNILRILLGLRLPEPIYNYGYIIKKA